MTKSFLLIPLIGLAACNNQAPNNQKKVSSTTGDTALASAASRVADTLAEAVDNAKIVLGYSTDDDTIVWEEPITITAEQYYQYAAAYHPAIDTSGKQITRTRNAIQLHTAARPINFIAEPSNEKAYNYYKGFIPSFKSYIINKATPGDEVVHFEIELVDSISGNLYILESAYDNGCEIPLPSPQPGLLLVYVSDMHLEDGTVLYILKYNSNTRQAYTKYAGLRLPKLIVRSIVWVDNHTLAAEVQPVITEPGSTTIQYITQKIP